MDILSGSGNSLLGRAILYTVGCLALILDLHPSTRATLVVTNTMLSDVATCLLGSESPLVVHYFARPPFGVRDHQDPG